MVLNQCYGHGGDIYKNDVALDFSINVNPYGTPEAVQRAIADSARSLDVYPDPYCGALRRALAETVCAPEADILCGNGAAELIYQFALALRPSKTLLPVPSFSDYERALDAAGCTPEFYPLRREEGFVLSEGILEAITEDTALLMLCNPNNPTGRCVPHGLLLRILDRCRETGTWLFVDECFLELSDCKTARSLIPALREDDRVFVLRAFTKLYGMAGVRLGYGVCRNRAMLAAICRLAQPWNVSAVAQAAGVAALGCGAWVEQTRAAIFREKQALLRALRARGFSVLPSDANFLLLSGVPGLYDSLLRQKILIRRCGNYRGLEAGDCRIAVRTPEENRRLLAALEELRHA